MFFSDLVFYLNTAHDAGCVDVERWGFFVLRLVSLVIPTAHERGAGYVNVPVFRNLEFDTTPERKDLEFSDIFDVCFT